MAEENFMRGCTRCTQQKSLSEFYKRKRGGYDAKCKACVLEIQKRRREADPEKCRAAVAAWAARNPEKLKAYALAWNERNPGKQKQISAEWSKRNPERQQAHTLAWRARNREKVSATKAAWRAENKERSKAINAQWRAANQELVRLYVLNRRARVGANVGQLSKGIEAKLLKLQGGKCPCCKQPLGDDYHLDHIMPLARGGTNTDDNVQLLRSACNHKKHAKHPVDFMQERGFLL